MTDYESIHQREKMTGSRKGLPSVVRLPTTQSAVTYHSDETAPLGGQIVINLERCNGCGQCITDCCSHAIELMS